MSHVNNIYHCDCVQPAAVESSAGSLGVMFMKSEGSWECDTCMVVNKPDASRCIACEASRPGMKRTSSEYEMTDPINTISVDFFLALV